MAAKKSGATSSSGTKEKVVEVKSVGRPNQTVAAIREQYRQEQDKQTKNFASASEDKVMRTVRDLTRNATTTSSITASDGDTIKGYLSGNIYGQSSNLIAASKYLYLRSPIYNKMIHTYADMYCLNCRKVIPKYTFSKGLDSKALKQYDATLDFLDILSMENNASGALLDMWINDISFNLFFHDDVGSFFYPIDASEAVIDSIYEIDGGMVYGYALDMSKWRSAQRQALIEWLGSPLTEMWQEYQRTNVKYVHVPAEYSLVLKKTPGVETIIPPLLPYFLSLAKLNDLADVQSGADEDSFYKLIYMPLETLQSAKNSDDWKISPDLAIDYFKIASQEAFPKGASSAVIPGEELKVIDFSDSVKNDVNRVDSSQNQILGSAGGVGALINSTKAVNNTELIKNALKAESAYALEGVIGQLSGWVNLQLMLNISNYCHTEFLPVTIFTKEDYRKSLIEAGQYGYMYRLTYGTLLGMTERETMAQLMFEQDVLGLQNLMIFPLQSSYTSSNNGESQDVGRPEKDSGDLSPSGERSRNQ